MKPQQQSLFSNVEPKEISTHKIDFLNLYREEFGLAKASLRKISAFSHLKKLKLSDPEKRSILQILNSETALSEISLSQRDLIFTCMPPHLKLRHAYPISFAKVAGTKKIYTSPSQAKALADEWNVIRRGTRYHCKDNKSDLENEYLKKQKRVVHAKEGSVRINSQAGFLAKKLAYHFNISKSTLINAALTYITREVLLGKGDSFLDALDLELSTSDTMGMLLSLRDRHMDKRPMKARLEKFFAAVGPLTGVRQPDPEELRKYTPGL